MLLGLFTFCSAGLAGPCVPGVTERTGGEGGAASFDAGRSWPGPERSGGPATTAQRRRKPPGPTSGAFSPSRTAGPFQAAFGVLIYVCDSEYPGDGFSNSKFFPGASGPKKQKKLGRQVPGTSPKPTPAPGAGVPFGHFSTPAF